MIFTSTLALASLLVAGIVALVVFTVRAKLLFDDLLRHMYVDHRVLWEDEGRPCGFRFLPDGMQLWRNQDAGFRLYDQLRSNPRTPGWIADDPEATRVRASFRWAIDAALVLWLLDAGVMICFAMWLRFVLNR